jgi:steroid delta-isomerase-like uncharacterized protein
MTATDYYRGCEREVTQQWILTMARPGQPTDSDEDHYRSNIQAKEEVMATAVTTLAEQLVGAWNTHDPERVIGLLTEDHVYEDVALAAVNHGAAETRQFFQGAYGAFPDIHFDLTGATVAGGRAAMEWTMTGTHNGDMPGLPATGKSFMVRGVTVFETGGDRIRVVRDYWDFTTLLRQVGLMPAPETT